MFSRPLSQGDTPEAAALDQCPRGWASFPRSALCIQVREKNPGSVLEDLKDTVAEDTATEVKTSRCDTLEETQMCVTIAVGTLLAKSGVADIWKSQDVVTSTKRLVRLTLQGLSVGPGYKADSRDIHNICKTVLSDMERTYGGTHKLRSAILSEQAKEEAAIVKCLQACITHHSVGSAQKKKKKKKRSGWRQHIWEVLPLAGICLIWGILAAVLL